MNSLYFSVRHINCTDARTCVEGGGGDRADGADHVDEGEGEGYEFELRSLSKRDEVFSLMEVLVHRLVA